MTEIKSLKRLVTLRARQVDRAQSELSGAEVYFAAQHAALLEAPPVEQLHLAQDFLSWQALRDEGYRRLPLLKGAVDKRRQELSEAKLELRQMEILFEKAAKAQADRRRRKESAMLDAWVASRHARSLPQ